jgi:hypothetical protein
MRSVSVFDAPAGCHARGGWPPGPSRGRSRSASGAPAWRRQLLAALTRSGSSGFRATGLHQVLQHLGVVGVDRADGVFAAAAQRPALLVARRVGQDGQVAVVGPGRRARGRSRCGRPPRSHPGVDDDGVDVHLAQLRQLAHHFRDAQQHLFQRLHVDRRAPRHSPRVSATRERSISRGPGTGSAAAVPWRGRSISSIMVPPAPKVITGPNGSSVTRPM